MSSLRQVKNLLPLASLGWLYLVQGIPYGLQDKFIPVQLRSHGLKYSSVSLLKVLLVPWVAKGLLAPLVEVWGGRRRWLLISLLALGVSACSGSFTAPADVMGIGCMLLALNIFSAIQDVAVDGLALQVLPDEQLGLGNTVQVVLYKVGSLIGGAGLTYLLAFTSWTVTFIMLALVYFFTAAFASCLSVEKNIPVSQPSPEIQRGTATKHTQSQDQPLYHIEERARHKPTTETSLRSPGESRAKQIRDILKEVVHTPGTLWLSVYVVLYKMGERGAINNMPLFLLDKGISKQTLAFWNGTVCQGLSILGSFYGGILLAKPNANVKTLLIQYSLYRLFAIMIHSFVVIVLDEFGFLKNVFVLHQLGVGGMCLLSYSSGVVSTASFTLMMQISRQCSKETQASHYNALASIEIAGKLSFAAFAGCIIDFVGMSWAFTLFTILCTFPLLVLKAMPDQLCHLKKE
ncbi:major facilitator superfamily domain-containing protein 3-like isoform X2 [Homarus americanus]|uniref:major facilitator superfamily domain-containing protein 3-like isoform X2 n=1 Tax=Homarus americanus TaxID=6706 RepID=UPI001C48F49E|nr:major facilitator superfamily domain-containing protein 3-like isoform X2 [Homarus americanus]